ncbi:unnamed protein product [Leptosia nina]|uniref:Uncharacterized protein n=1 Tax=Leptosia nina TaxID=320188 RepID=A0AAV1JWX0_9NEOP
MSKRLDEMKWIWSLLVLYLGPVLSPVNCGALPTQPNKPTATGVIESQAKYFQDFFSVQLSPYKIEFGHVCEDPNTWEQRYEKKDYKNHRDMGKVRWGDKKGGYGEHYWDLNHAGHNNDHDDGEYNSDGYHDDHDSYDEPSEQSSHYEEDIPNDNSSYEETERKKRANSQKGKNLDDQRHQVREIDDRDDEIVYKERTIKQHKRRSHEPKKREKNDIVLIVKQRDIEDEEEEHESHQKASSIEDSTRHHQNQDNSNEPVTKGNPEQSPNDEWSMRQNQNLESSVAPSNLAPEPTPNPYVRARVLNQQDHNVPRLFLDAATGRVIDRATGQAYVLQPIIVNQ